MKREFTLKEMLVVGVAVLLLALAAILVVRYVRYRQQLPKFIVAMNSGDTETAIKLIKANPNLSRAKSSNGVTPLHFAADSNAKDVAELLLAKGADINAKIGGGITPLHLAVYCDAKDVAELLLAKGADVNARDNGGLTPLEWAISYDKQALAELLRKHGAKETTESDGR